VSGGLFGRDTTGSPKREPSLSQNRFYGIPTD
jgi:hypothetical protein